MHTLISFSTNNARLLRFLKYGVLFLLVTTIVAWVLSYFYCTNIKTMQWYTIPTNRDDTLSACTLCGKIYCFQSNMKPHYVSGARLPFHIGKVFIFTNHYRIYFRRDLAREPWSEFMGYKVIHFSLSFWVLVALEMLLFIAIRRLQRCAISS
jgi:hypothetical protein